MRDNARDRVLELLDEPGSRSKQSLIEELEGEVEPVEVTRSLGELIVENVVEEHPKIGGVYRIVPDP